LSGDDPSQNQEVLISISADGRVCQWTIRYVYSLVLEVV